MRQDIRGFCFCSSCTKGESLEIVGHQQKLTTICSYNTTVFNKRCWQEMKRYVIRTVEKTAANVSNWPWRSYVAACWQLAKAAVLCLTGLSVVSLHHPRSFQIIYNSTWCPSCGHHQHWHCSHPTDILLMILVLHLHNSPCNHTSNQYFNSTKILAIYGMYKFNINN